MSERFQVVTVNPNDTPGGGGCLCSEARNTDTQGPYAVFYHQEMESNASPHAVLCAPCARAVVEHLDSADEPLKGGEVDAESVTEVPEDDVPEL